MLFYDLLHLFLLIYYDVLDVSKTSFILVLEFIPYNMLQIYLLILNVMNKLYLFYYNN